MKAAYYFKCLDLLLQVSALGYAVTQALYQQNWPLIGWAYFYVGCVQFTSCLFNRVLLKFEYRNAARICYEKILFALTCGFAVILVYYGLSQLFHVLRDTNTMYGLMYIYGSIYIIILMFTSPFLAVWYGAITFSEIRIIRSYDKRRDWI